MAIVIVLMSKSSDNGDSLPMFEFNASQQPLPNTAVKLLLPWTAFQSEEVSLLKVLEALLEAQEKIADAPGHPAMRRTARIASTSPSSGASELRQCK